MANIVIRLGLLLLLGCSSQPKSVEKSIEDTAAEPMSVLEFQYEYRLLLTEQLGDCIDAAYVDAFLQLCNTEAGTHLMDERDDSFSYLGDYSSIAGTRTVEQDILLALDGLLYVYGETGLVSVENPIPALITKMVRHGDDVWLWGDGRLFRWTNQTASEVSLPDYPNIHGFAVSDDRLYLSVPWLIEAQTLDGTLQVVSVQDTSIDALATDAAGNLWYVADQTLFLKRPDEDTRQIALPESIVDVVGPTIWIQGEETAFRYHDAVFSRHSLSHDEWLHVDDYGRLLQLGEGQFQRHSIDRPVVVTGLSESLMIRETAQLLPSDPESVSSLKAWLDTEPLEVSSEPWLVVVDPNSLSDGAHKLRFLTESEEGDRQDEYPVWVGELPEVYWEDIESLSQEHCIACHGGATLTDLSTKADWERLIDSIIYQVSMNYMPQNGTYLTEEQITMIRGWKHGGFQ